MFAAAGSAEHALVAGPWRIGGAAVFAAPAVLAAWTLALHPPQLDRHPFSRLEANKLVQKINDASLHRRNTGLTPDPFSSGAEMEQREAYTHFLSKKPTRPYASVVNGWWCAELYRQFDTRVVHGYGLTDALLARVNVPADRPGHKDALTILSRDLVRVVGRAGERAGADMYRHAVAEGIAAPWIVANLDTIELIARKVYNRHDFAENLRLAFSFPDRLDLRTDSELEPDRGFPLL